MKQVFFASECLLRTKGRRDSSPGPWDWGLLCFALSCVTVSMNQEKEREIEDWSRLESEMTALAERLRRDGKMASYAEIFFLRRICFPNRVQ